MFRNTNLLLECANFDGKKATTATEKMSAEKIQAVTKKSDINSCEEVTFLALSSLLTYFVVTVFVSVSLVRLLMRSAPIVAVIVCLEYKLRFSV